VTDKQFDDLRAALHQEAITQIAAGVLKTAPGSNSAAFVDAFTNGMLVELSWCIVHFNGLLSNWFTVLRVMDEVSEQADGINFVAYYNQVVPESIKVRNNNLLGVTGWGR
jgi:hypothetical protein